jgi:hypothetical protein
MPRPRGPRTLNQALTATPPVTQVFGVPAIERARAVVATYGPATVVRWQMHGRDGTPIDLTAGLPGGSSAGIGPGGSVAGDEPGLQLRMREASGCGAVATYPASCVTPADAAAGWVEAVLRGTKDLTGPGIYRAELGLVDAGGTPVVTNPLLIYLEPSLFDPVPAAPGPPPVADVRMTLRDSSPAESQLIATTAWDDAEVALAMLRVIEKFNAMPPQLSTRATTHGFPTYWWCRGAAAILYRMAADYCRKNHLAYQAGGVSVDDLNKAAEYDAAAQAAQAEFDKWAQSARIQASMNECWGSAASPYGFWALGNSY